MTFTQFPFPVKCWLHTQNLYSPLYSETAAWVRRRQETAGKILTFTLLLIMVFILFLRSCKGRSGQRVESAADKIKGPFLSLSKCWMTSQACNKRTQINTRSSVVYRMDGKSRIIKTGRRRERQSPTLGSIFHRWKLLKLLPSLVGPLLFLRLVVSTQTSALTS